MKRFRCIIPKLETRNSREIFMLFSAMNLMGYNEENNPRGMSDERKRVRNVLRAYDWRNKYPRLASVIKKHHPWYLVRWILLKDKRLSDLERFAQEKDVQKQWNELKIRFKQKTKKIATIFERETNRLITFIGTPPKQLKKIILIVNPLDAYWRGYAFNIKGTGYIIVGPEAEKNGGRLIRHELLHLFTPTIQISKNIIVDQRHRRLIAQGYGSNSAIKNEYVVRSLNLLYQRGILKKNISQAIKNEENDFPHIRKVMQIIMVKLKRGVR